ncbi:MAG: hypothetical protein PHH08_00780 [Candidatus ainarchaeum sp.]|nr:hypothetical protein [Candidatus ainarchaeum sp.]
MKKIFSGKVLSKTSTNVLAKTSILAVFMVFIAATVFGGSMQVTSTSSDPSPAMPGQYITLWINMTNKSVDAAKDALVVLSIKTDEATTTYPFSFETGDNGTRQLGTIDPYKTAVARYRILVDPNALDGTYNIYALTGEEGLTRQSVSISIKILSRKPSLQIISVTPDSAIIGEPTDLVLTIKNTGSSRAYNLSVGPTEDRSITTTGVVVERVVVPLGTAFSYLPELGANETTEARLKIMMNPGSDPKAYYIPIKMTFLDENKTEYTKTDYIGLKVSDEAEIGALVSEESVLPQPGIKSEITVDIYNSGDGKAHVLQATVESDFAAIKKNSFFVGSLESDDFDSIVLDAEINKDAQPGMHSLAVEVTYKDNFGEPHKVTRIVPVKIYSAAEAAADGNGSGLLVLAAAIIIIVLIAAFFFLRRRGKKQKK